MRSNAPDATLDCLRMLFFVYPLPGSVVFGARPIASSVVRWAVWTMSGAVVAVEPASETGVGVARGAGPDPDDPQRDSPRHRPGRDTPWGSAGGSGKRRATGVVRVLWSSCEGPSGQPAPAHPPRALAGLRSDALPSPPRADPGEGGDPRSLARTAVCVHIRPRISWKTTLHRDPR